jgi:flagellar biosynthesis chaperone FliJ
MANNSLDTIIKMATELKAKMGENEKDIPAWIQDHITNAENFISQASSNYHEYGQNEARIAEDKGPCWQGYKQVGMKDKGGRQVPNCVPNESVVKEISGRTPKIFVKTAAVEKKIKELMADRKKAVVPYNTEKDPKKKEILKQILIKLTNQIKGYEKNLIQLRDMEEEYLQQMHADVELDTSGL